MALNMETNYCGFRCENPFILASSPVSATGEMICRAFEEGWAGAVTKSISFLQDELNLSLSPRMLPISASGAKGVTGMGNIDFVMDKCVNAAFADFAKVKERYPEKMLIISVKAQYVEADWKTLARKAQNAGADALELCLSCIDSEAGVMICQEKELMQQVIRWVKEEVQIPVIAKLSIHVNDIGKMALYAAEAGADAVTGINSIHGIGPLNPERMVHIRFFRKYPYHSPFAYISFAAKSALLHLPYIVRFTIFNLLFVPSTKPFESSLATEFSTASISFSNPFANRDISFKSEFLYRSINKYNRGILFFSYISRNSRTQCINSLSLGYFCKIYALWFSLSSTPIQR